jgi:uncharacterized protein (DUF885 family)
LPARVAQVHDRQLGIAHEETDMDRRDFLASSGAFALALSADPTFAKGAAARGDKALLGLLDAMFADGIARSPEFATVLGLDKGKLAHLRSKLTPPTAAERRAGLARSRAWLSRLNAIPASSLGAAAKRYQALVRYQLEEGITSPGRFDIDSVQFPYRINQQGGAYFGTPDFLDSSHPIESASDAEAYLARLAAFAVQLDQDSASQKAEAARGLVAPSWSIDLAVGQMLKLREAAPANSGMAQSLANRAKAKGLAGDWGARAAKIIAGAVYPALDRQIALMTALKAKTAAGDGAWRIPGGSEIYAAALAQATTTNLSPEEVHKIGLEQVADISAQLDAILKDAGLTQGSVAERLTVLNKRPDQLYPDSAEGRKALIESLNAGMADMATRLPRAFADVPSKPLDIRRVPVEIQDGASNGYYNIRLARWFRRPAIYWINLKVGRLAEVLAAGADLSRRQSGASPARLLCPAIGRPADAAAEQLHLQLMARAGRSMPKGGRRTGRLQWARAGRVACRASCSARRDWWSIPACTTSAGS